VPVSIDTSHFQAQPASAGVSRAAGGRTCASELGSLCALFNVYPLRRPACRAAARARLRESEIGRDYCMTVGIYGYPEPAQGATGTRYVMLASACIRGQRKLL
jgi:hypothetical protein